MSRSNFYSAVYGVRLSDQEASDFIAELKSELVGRGADPLDFEHDEAFLWQSKEHFGLSDFVLMGDLADGSVQSSEWFNEEYPLESYVLGFKLDTASTKSELRETIGGVVDTDLVNQWNTILSVILGNSGVNRKAKTLIVQQSS